MSPPPLKEIRQAKENDAPWWTLYIDGAANNKGVGAEIVLISPEGHKLSSAILFSFRATNNDVEYEALINDLQLALEMKLENLNVFSDSSLVVFQVNEGYRTRGPQTKLYYKFMNGLIKRFNEVIMEQVQWAANVGAYVLSKMGSQREATMLGVIPLKIQIRPIIHEKVVMTLNAPSPTWMTPVWAYFKEGIIPNDPKEARRVRYKLARYVIYDEVLYMRGFNTPLLKCIDGDEWNYILHEVHKGNYSNHSGGSSASPEDLKTRVLLAYSQEGCS